MLIICKERKKEISNTVASCPHCGYKLEKTKKKLKSSNNTLNVLAFSLFIQSFILGFFPVTFSRSVYNNHVQSQVLNKSFLDVGLESIDYFEPIYTVIGIISILMLSIYIFKSFNTFVLKKININKFICYAPTIICTLIEVIMLINIIYGGIDVHTSSFDVYYGVLWGGIWFTILLVTSSLLLIIDLIKSKRK